MCFSYIFCPHFNAEIKMEITSVRFIFGLLRVNQIGRKPAAAVQTFCAP